MLFLVVFLLQLKGGLSYKLSKTKIIFVEGFSRDANSHTTNDGLGTPYVYEAKNDGSIFITTTGVGNGQTLSFVLNEQTYSGIINENRTTIPSYNLHRLLNISYSLIAYAKDSVETLRILLLVTLFKLRKLVLLKIM